MSASFVFAKSAPSTEYDRALAWAALLLAATGLVMVYSASISTAEAARYTGNNAAWYLARHGLVLGISLAAAGIWALATVFCWPKQLEVADSEAAAQRQQRGEL